MIKHSKGATLKSQEGFSWCSVGEQRARWVKRNSAAIYRYGRGGDFAINRGGMFGFSQRPNKEIIGNSSLGIGKVSIPDWTDDLRNKVYQLRSVHLVGSATIGSHFYWYRAFGQPVLLITLIFMTNLLIKKASPPLKSLTGWQIISNSSGHELKSIDLLMLHNIWSTPCWHRSTLCSTPGELLHFKKSLLQKRRDSFAIKQPSLSTRELRW